MEIEIKSYCDGWNFKMNHANTVIAAVGDTHGHLQLALCVLARWQNELDIQYDAVLLCGDVGTFTNDDQLDSATRAFAKKNPCELEFLRQWATVSQAPWLDWIFVPKKSGGLGLTCPVLMVHGNHEGFNHLKKIVPRYCPPEPVQPEDLPEVDTNGHVRLLPSGWTMRLASGCLVGGIGGIDHGSRTARYDNMAYIDETAVLSLLEGSHLDILITHQGPREVQGEHGSELLQMLLDEQTARVWFHAHSTPNPDVVRVGRDSGCVVVPLADIAFKGAADGTESPGEDGWALATLTKDSVNVRKETPPFLRDFRLRKWTTAADGRLVCPSLVAMTRDNYLSA